jgi:imidazolonepropionase-like amidohydrolase
MVSGGNASHWTDPLKAYFGAEELKVIVDEAHSQGKLVAAHIHGGPGVRFAVEAGIDTLEHGSFVTDDAEIDLIASRGVAWMFNQGGRMADANSDLDLLKLYGNQILRSRKTSIVAFQKAKKAGIRIILGADGYHDDHACVLAMEALVKCGATPQEALRAATRTPAEIFGMIHERGTLEAGKFADLLVINANPFENISALRDIQMAIKEGRDYSDLRRENSNS